MGGLPQNKGRYKTSPKPDVSKWPCLPGQGASHYCQKIRLYYQFNAMLLRIGNHIEGLNNFSFIDPRACCKTLGLDYIEIKKKEKVLMSGGVCFT